MKYTAQIKGEIRRTVIMITDYGVDDTTTQ